MDTRISKFIANNKLLTLSVIDDTDDDICVYTASCYYAFCLDTLTIIFKSSLDSKHIKLANKFPKCGVNIAKDGALKTLQGVQIKAHFKHATAEQKALYYKTFPYAKLGEGEVFSLEILWAKYTDNSLFLGKKIEYIKE